MSSIILRTSDLAQQVLALRGTLVLLDYVLADLYGIETRVLKQAVRRNPDRFPPDFFFELSQEELQNLTSQNVISSHGGRRYRPFAFTEQGVAMLSSVVNSPRAIQVNIAIMRTFVEMRRMLEAHADLAGRLDLLEEQVFSRLDANDTDIRKIFEVLSALIYPPNPPRRPVGFITGNDEPS